METSKADTKSLIFISCTIMIHLTLGFDYNWSQEKRIIMINETQNQTFCMLQVATHILHVALYSYSMSFFLLHYSIYMIPPFYHHKLLSIITSSSYCKYRVSEYIPIWIHCLMASIWQKNFIEKNVYKKKFSQKKIKIQQFLTDLFHSAVAAQSGIFSQCE